MNGGFCFSHRWHSSILRCLVCWYYCPEPEKGCGEFYHESDEAWCVAISAAPSVSWLRLPTWFFVLPGARGSRCYRRLFAGSFLAPVSRLGCRHAAVNDELGCRHPERCSVVPLQRAGAWLGGQRGSAAAHRARPCPWRPLSSGAAPRVAKLSNLLLWVKPQEQKGRRNCRARVTWIRHVIFNFSLFF